MEDEFSESVCNIKSKARPTPTLQVIELNSLTLPSASFQVYYVSIALIQNIGNNPMSDIITFHNSAIRSAVTAFTDATLRKHSHYPAKEDDLRTFAECRERMKSLGVSENTLDDFESYVKKLIAGIYEQDADKLIAISTQFVREVHFDVFRQGMESGKEVQIIAD